MRETIDRVTAAMVSHDPGEMAAVYAEDAVAVTPEEGTPKGRDETVRRLGGFLSPGSRWPITSPATPRSTRAGSWAPTRPSLALLDGSIMPATGRAVRVRGCDIATVAGDVIVRHHLHFDQMDLSPSWAWHPSST